MIVLVPLVIQQWVRADRMNLFCSVLPVSPTFTITTQPELTEQYIDL